MLLLASLAGMRSAEASFGTDYRQLTATSGSTNTGTSIVISSVGTTNYLVDPYTLLSTLSGTPSSSVLSSYGWRTAGAFGQSVPAGTWSFNVEVDNTGVALGTAIVRVYAYSTDLLGGDIDPIGTADSTNVLTTLASTQSRSMSFSASARDLTNRVLVIEYWLIATNVSVATVTFHAVSTVTSVTVPTSSPTVFYLGTPRLYSAGLDDSFVTADSAVRLYGASRTAADSIGVADAINMQVTRSISDAITVSGQVVTGTSRPLADTLATSDAISIAVSRSVPEALPISDGISIRLSRPVSDGLPVADSAQRTQSIQKQVSDDVSVADAIVPVTLRALPDSLSVSDSASRQLSAFRGTSDAIAATDSISAAAHVFRSAGENLSVSDSAQVSVAVTLSESVIISEQVAHNSFTFNSMSDPLTVMESVAANLSAARNIADTLAAADAATAGTPVVRNLSDSIVIAETAQTIKAIAIADTLSVNAQITNISVQWNRSFDESLGMSDCTPFSCNQTLHLAENLALADVFAPPPSIADTISVGDSAAASIAHPAGAGDSLGVSAAVAIEIRPSPVAPAPGSPVPPLGAMVVSDRDSAGLLPAAPVSGTYSVQGGDPALLYDQLRIPPQPAGVAGPPLAIVLPTYHVSLVPTPRLPIDDALLTVRMAEIPAGTPVTVPIDIAATPETADHRVPWIKIGYTPAVDSTNFGLAVSLLDTPPAGAQQQAGVTPMYVNIRWVGSFGAGTSPGAGSYYRDSPTLAFAVTDGWTTQNSVQRDENGVPVVSLNLLDEVTGLWQPVRLIDRPAAATNGQYAYVAHLEHFSTYAITAVRSGSHAAPVAAPPAIAPSTLSARIAESLLVQDAGTGATSRAQLSKAAALAENIRLSSSSDAYIHLDAGDVDVKMRVTSITPAGPFPPTAQVTFDAELVNVGYSPKELVLGFAGDRQYHSSVVKVGAGESKNVSVQVPFGSPGTFGILAEVRSAGGELLDSTTFTVTVPWLDVYLYFLIVLQAILAAIIAAGIFILLKYRRAWT